MGYIQYIKPSQETTHATSAPAAGTAFDHRRIHRRFKKRPSGSFTRCYVQEVVKIALGVMIYTIGLGLDLSNYVWN